MMKNLISLPYELARKPFGVVDHLAARLPENAAPRVAVDKALGTADMVAGTVLRNDAITIRGAERLERSEKLRTAARLEAQAATSRDKARGKVSTGREEAAEKRRAAQDRVQAGLEEADEVEARGKQEAKDRARKTAAAKKSAAEQRADAKVAAAEQEKKRAEAAAEAQKKAAQKRAQAELEDARETKLDAAEDRADAERLEDLVDVKKDERKQG